MIGSEAARAIGTISQLAAQALFWKNSLRFYIISNKATIPTCHVIRTDISKAWTMK